MSREIVDIVVLKEYISGVVERSKHHARGVGDICLVLAGAIIWKADKIRVMERDGKLANALWLDIGPNRYVLSYNHASGEIEVRDRNIQGSVLISFTDETPISAVKKFFESL